MRPRDHFFPPENSHSRRTGISVRNAHSWVTFLHRKKPDNRNIFGGDKQPFVYPRQVAFVSLTNRSSRENAPHPHRSFLPQEMGVRVIRNDLTNVPGQKPLAGPGYVAVLPGRILSARRRFVDAGVFFKFSFLDRSEEVVSAAAPESTPSSITRENEGEIY